MLSASLSLAAMLHPLHVSVTEIEMDEKDKSLEIMMRVFVDDMELTLKKDRNLTTLDITRPTNGLTVDQMASSYLNGHFKISLDGKAQQIKYLGHEVEDEAFIFYCEIRNVKKWKTIQIQNDIIIEVHEDQSNLVHVTVGETIKSLRLTKDTPADKLTFNIK
jgi:hypothetical protein